MSDLSFALVFMMEDEKFNVVETSKIMEFQPKHRSDFIKGDEYICKINRNRFENVQIFGLGDKGEMDSELIIVVDSMTISHALVNFLEDDLTKVIKIDDIKEFSDVFKPKHKDHFLKEAIYNAKMRDMDTKYEKVKIICIGDLDEVSKIYEANAGIEYALVRMLKDDSLIVIKIVEICQYSTQKPENFFDFEEDQIYNAIVDNIQEKIQILKLDKSFIECARQIDEYNKITHAFVRFVQEKEFRVLNVCDILVPELDKNQKLLNRRRFAPEDCKDFCPNNLYVGKRGGKMHAIHIFKLGHKRIMEFQLANSEKRLRLPKFNTSDIQEICLLSDSSNRKLDTSSDTEESENTEIQPRKRKSRTRNVIDSNTDDSSVERAKKKKQEEAASLHAKRQALHANNAIKQFDMNSEDSDIERRRLYSLSRNHGSNESQGDKSPTDSAFSLHSFTGLNNPVTSTPKTTRRNIMRQQEPTLSSNGISKRLIERGSLPIEKVYNIPGQTDQQRLYHHCKLSDWDDDIGELENLKAFELFYETNANGKSVKMIHLGWDVVTPYDKWREAKEESNEVKFIKALSRGVFGKQIVNKCLELKPFMNKEERSLITDEEIKAFRQALRYWVMTEKKELLKNKTMKKLMASVTSTLSVEIGYQRRYLKSNNTNRRTRR